MMTLTPTRPLSTRDVHRLTGATFRQLDYGYRAGYLLPSNTFGGSGSRLDWSEGEALVIARLVEVERAVPFVSFAELARLHAATLRAGRRVELRGTWGVVVIEPRDAPLWTAES